MAVSSNELKILLSLSDQASGGLRSFGGSLGGLGDAAKVAGVAAIAGGAAIVGAVGVGIKAAGDLQQAVANISTIKPTIDTSEVFNSLNEMSTRVPQTAAQLGDAMYNIFSSIDVSQSDAIALTETFAKGAVGAATDAQTFGTAALGVMNAYGLAASDAEHISDVFFNTVNSGVVTGQQLASSLGPVTAAAKAAGVGLDELGGLIVGVTKEGGDAAQNINNLTNLLAKVTTTAAQGGMHDLGVATQDAEGHFRTMPAILTDLKAALGEMTQAEAAAALQKIFPDLQARQGAQVIMDQLDSVNKAIDDNINKTGSASEAYKKMSGTFNSQMQLLQNTGMAILTRVGAEILPIITPMVTAFAQALPAAFNSTRAGFAGIAAGFAGLSIAGTPALQFLKDVGGTLQQAFAGNWSPDASINPVINVMGQLGTAVRTASQTVSDAWGTVQQVFAGNWSPDPSQINPFTEKIGEMAIVVRDTVIPAFLQFTTAAGPAIGAFAQAVDQVIGLIVENFGTIAPIIAGVVAGFAAFQALTAIAGTIAGIAGTIGAVSVAVAGMSSAFALAGGGMAGVIAILGGPVTLAILGIVAVVALLTAAWAGNWGDIQGKTAAAGAAIGAVLSGIGAGISQIAGIVGPVMAQIGDNLAQGFQTGDWGAALAAQAQLAMDLLAPVGEAIGAFFSGLGTTIQEALSGVGETIGGQFSDLGTAAQAGVQGIGDAFSALGSLLAGAVSAAGAAAIGVWESAVDAPTRQLLGELVVAVGELFGAMGTLIGAKMSQLGATISAGWTAISTDTQTQTATSGAAVSAGWATMAADVGTQMSTIGASVNAGWTAVATDIGTQMSTIGTSVNAGWTTVATATESKSNEIGATISRIWSGFGDIISSAMAPVASVVTGAWNSISSSVMSILQGLADSAGSYGSGMVRAFGAGITGNLENVLSTVRSMTQRIRDMLPGSDAKTGPLSDLTDAGAAFAKTFATGILQTAGLATQAAATVAGGARGALDLPSFRPNFARELTGAQASGQAAGQAYVEGATAAISSGGPALAEAAAEPIVTALDYVFNAVANAGDSDMLTQLQTQLVGIAGAMGVQGAAGEAQKLALGTITAGVALSNVADILGETNPQIAELLHQYRIGALDAAAFATGLLAIEKAQQDAPRATAAAATSATAAVTAAATTATAAVEPFKTALDYVFNAVANAGDTDMLPLLQTQLINVAAAMGVEGAAGEAQKMASGIISAGTALANVADAMKSTSPQVAELVHQLYTGKIDAQQFALSLLQVMKAQQDTAAAADTAAQATAASTGALRSFQPDFAAELTVAQTSGQAAGQAYIENLAAAISGGDAGVAESVRAIVTTALKYGIDPAIALAVSRVESAGLNTNAIGDQGHSVGLFQLHDQGQGAGMSTAQRQDPWINSEKFLSQHAEEFKALVAQGVSGPELAKIWGGNAEVSAKEYWDRYAAAYSALSAQFGPELAGKLMAATTPTASAATQAAEPFKTALDAVFNQVANANGADMLPQLQSQLVGIAAGMGVEGAAGEAQKMALGIESSGVALANVADAMKSANPQIAELVHQLYTGQIDAQQFALSLLTVMKAQQDTAAAADAAAKATAAASGASGVPGTPGAAPGGARTAGGDAPSLVGALPATLEALNAQFLTLASSAGPLTPAFDGGARSVLAFAGRVDDTAGSLTRLSGRSDDLAQGIGDLLDQMKSLGDWYDQQRTGGR